MIERVVREKSTSAGWYNWSTFKYDGRGQLLDEKYTYSADGSSTTLVYQATNAYDLAGNVIYRVLKRLESSTLVDYVFNPLSYSRGYQLLSFTVTQNANTWTYNASYDARGNMLELGTGSPFTFPSFTYDSLNNVASYSLNGTTWYLWRDPLGRVFRKADTSGVDPDTATHYYYAFNALAQEYDMSITAVNDDIEFDYLRGFDGHVLRRRDVEDGDPDRQPLKDLLASPLNLVNADDGEMSGTTSGYTFDAWGESFEAGDGQGQPAETNHIRYHGAFTEEFVSSDDTDGIYRMGARHYSTVLGRFFQREPMTLVGLPNPANPLGVNAYLYSHNSPTTMSDISGLATGMHAPYSEGILYRPEKPREPEPFVPMPDPDPGFEAPGDFPSKPGMMELQNPWGPPPWWDRRNPDIPLPNPGWTMIMPAPVDPGPGTTPLGPPPAPGTPFINPPKNPWDGVLMGASSRGGSDVTSGPGWQASGGASGQHLKPNEGYAQMIFTGTSSYTKSDHARNEARYKTVHDAEIASYGSYEQRLANAIAGEAAAKEEARKAKAAVWWGLARDFLLAVGVGLTVGLIFGSLVYGIPAACGRLAAMRVINRSCTMRLFGLGRYFYTRGFSRYVNVAKSVYTNLAGNIQRHHIFPNYLRGTLSEILGQGRIAKIDAAYHQFFTNAWRNRYAYGKGHTLDPAEFIRVANEIHRYLPLPYRSTIGW